MDPRGTRHCPACDGLNSIDQTICRACLQVLPAHVSALPEDPVITETVHLYRASLTGALLILSRTGLEYTGPQVAFTTTWNNVASISQEIQPLLRLYQTPQQIRLPLGSSSTWFSDMTRTVPLQPFGYPDNYELRRDLGAFAPHLRRFTETKRYPRD